ncbi:MAG: DUF1499 domain-containing protein [Pseudomonadota bacterium]
MKRLWRIVKIILIVAVIGLAGTAVGMRNTTDDAAKWHVDPAIAERTGRPNDYLVAPAGAAASTPDREPSVHLLPPEELLFLFDAVARPSRNVDVIAGGVKDRHITYVQRTTVLGFPDYISVKAIEVDGGSALIIWSRSRYGYSDLGVNKKRIDAWLAQIDKPNR